MNKAYSANLIGTILTILSVFLLIPGLLMPIVSMKITITIPLFGEKTLMESTYSILKSIEMFNEEGNWIVAGLILVFSVLVPFAKSLLILLAVFKKNLKNRKTLDSIIKNIGKWSMADLFVVAIFIVFQSASSNDNYQMQLHEGFYLFTGYCLVSLLGIQLMKIEEN